MRYLCRYSFLFSWPVCLVLIVHFSCRDRSLPKAQPWITCQVNQFPAQLAMEWYELELKFIRQKPGFTPPVAARTLGYTGIVLYESLVSGMPSYQSLGPALQMPRLPKPKRYDYHWVIGANAAMASALKHFTGELTPANLLEIENLEQCFYEQFSKDIPFEQAKESVEYGNALENAIYEWAKTDGGVNGFIKNYGPFSSEPAMPGRWQPTAFTGGLLPNWGKNRPFLAANGQQCQPPPPPVYSDDKSSELYKEAMEVYRTSLTLSDDQADVAKFWADPPGSTFTPAGHSMLLLCHLIDREGWKLDSAAIAFSKLGIALNDAFISCWQTKYVHQLVRPITYIRKNIQEYWIPFLTTPVFPEYSSGHSVQSAAMAEVMSSLFGDQYSFTDYTNDTLGYKRRYYASFRACAREAAMSRLYGGIHFPVSIKNGYKQGEMIGKNVAALRYRK